MARGETMTHKYGYGVKINKPAVAGQPFLVDSVFVSEAKAKRHAEQFHKDIQATVVPVRLVEVRKIPSGLPFFTRLRKMVASFL